MNVSLTTPITAPALADVCTLEPALNFISAALRHARWANVYNQCATSLPIQSSSPLPIGLQIACAHGRDTDLLAISAAVERMLHPGRPKG